MQRFSYRNTHGQADAYAQGIKRAYGTFLQIPSYVLLGFVALFAITYYVDQLGGGWLAPLNRFMGDHVFADAGQTGNLLQSIAGSLITMTSITVSVLLLAVQQAASAMTHQVLDQFLRRKLNQVIFGYFVGLALYAMAVHATVDKPFNPIIGATVVLILTAVALYLLLVLIYTTINQMRPSVVVRAIRDLTLAGRKAELQIVARTVPHLEQRLPLAAAIDTEVSGYLTRLDIGPVLSAINDAPDEVQVEFVAAVGDFLTVSDTVARVYAGEQAIGERVAHAVLQHMEIATQRDPTSSAGYGIEQLRTIGWTTGSTARQNPSTALAVLYMYRDLIVRWTRAPFQVERDPTSPISYHDNTVEQLFLAMEQLAAVATKSDDVMAYGAILRGFVDLVDRLPPSWVDRYLQALGHIVPLLAKFDLTSALDRTLDDLRHTLLRLGDHRLVGTLDQARHRPAGTP